MQAACDSRTGNTGGPSPCPWATPSRRRGLPTAQAQFGDFWSSRYEEASPRERNDVSAYYGERFAKIIEQKSRHFQSWSKQSCGRAYYPAMRKTYVSDPHINPVVRSVGLNGMYYDYDKDDYYAWRHRGPRWSKTSRFPKSRWTKDWDHNRDKKLAHRPVARFCETSHNTINRWVKQTESGYWTGKDRLELLDENANSVTGDLGPGAYLPVQAWEPKPSTGDPFQPMASFQSTTKRDIYGSPGLGHTNDGPSKPPTAVFVSTEEERRAVQRKLTAELQRMTAIEDWGKKRKGFTFPRGERLSITEQCSRGSQEASKHYVRVSVDPETRVCAYLRGEPMLAAVIVPCVGPPAQEPGGHSSPPAAAHSIGESRSTLSPWDVQTRYGAQSVGTPVSQHSLELRAVPVATTDGARSREARELTQQVQAMRSRARTAVTASRRVIEVEESETVSTSMLTSTLRTVDRQKQLSITLGTPSAQVRPASFMLAGGSTTTSVNSQDTAKAEVKRR